MLRLVLVSGIIVVGAYFAFQAPFYALLFYLWNAYFRPDKWVWGDLIAKLDLSFIIGTYLVVAAFLARVPLRFDGRILLLVLFSVQSIVSVLCSQYLALSWGYWVEFSRIFLITYLLVLLVDDLPKLRLTLLVIALSLGFEGAKQGWPEMIVHPGSANPNTIVFLGDNNGVAVGMLMLVPVFLLLAQTSARRWERFLHHFLLVGVLYRGLSTYSRGAFVASIVLASVYWLRSRRKLLNLVGGIVVVTPLLLLFSTGYWQRMSTIRDVAKTEDASILGRMHFWKVAVVMADDNPLVGCGFHAFEACYDRYDFSLERYRTERAAHSAWFGVLGEQGYVGLALYLAIIPSCSERAAPCVGSAATMAAPLSWNVMRTPWKQASGASSPAEAFSRSSTTKWRGISSASPSPSKPLLGTRKRIAPGKPGPWEMPRQSQTRNRDGCRRRREGGDEFRIHNDRLRS